MKKLWNDLLNLFYPNLCRLCKTPLIDGEEQICLQCLWDLPRTAYHKQSGNPAEQLFFNQSCFQQATAFLRYEKKSNVQKLIHAIKYHNNKNLGFLLGKQMALELSHSDSLLLTADILIPVPLHPRKKRKRGYNQSEWIALGIHSITNISINTSALQRIRKTKSQTNKSVYNRWLNVKDIFTVIHPHELTGKHVLLVDDVITSGATVSACMEALSSVPDIRISVLSLAIA